jgi:hypothetical protein
MKLTLFQCHRRAGLLGVTKMAKLEGYSIGSGFGLREPSDLWRLNSQIGQYCWHKGIEDLHVTSSMTSPMVAAMLKITLENGRK